MRRVLVQNVEQGSVLADDLFDSRGALMIAKGTRLTEQYLARLLAGGVAEILIEDPLLADVESRPVLSSRTRQMGLIVFSHLADQIKRARESSPKAVVTPTGLAPYVKNLMDDLTEQNPVRFDPVVVADPDYLPGHALNVSGLAACMALNSQYRNLAPDLAQAGLLADLGMVTVADIAQRPQESWTEAEAAAVKAHPKVSLQLMDRSFSAHVKAAVSGHHERMDGSGYPEGRRGEDIHPVARLLAVADTYMALIVDRPYRPRMLPHEALELVMSMAGEELDLAMVELLLRTVSPFPPGVSVMLSSGRRAVVVRNGVIPTRPVVRIMSDPEGGPLLVDLDLSQPEHQTEMITEVLYD